MRIRHFHSVDSGMVRYWRESDTLVIYDDFGHEVLTLSAEQVMQWIAAQAAQAKIVIDLARQTTAVRDLYPRRRLLGQHKALRGRD